ncbi:MAG: single-stranded DNA-binding protein [Candidatus Kaiserbacteria bacterium]|nr:single-stranded DNA-binding protein [Candidatus Kaiserbacteria bacterium]
MYLNKVFLYGNLTRDPELKALPSGQNLVSFGLATNRTYKDKNGQKQEATEFHNIVAFGRPAEVIAQYMKKGRPLFIEGRIQTRSWEGKEDGKKQYRTEIVVDNFQFGDGGKGGGFSASSGQAARGEEPQNAPKDTNEIQYPDEEINPEDIPF